MNIRDLDHILTIEEPWRSLEGGGGYTTTWQPVATDPVVHAAVAQTGGGQSQQAGRAQFDASYAITLRWRDDLRPDLRLHDTENDIAYKITAIDDTDPAKTWLTVRATRSLLP